MKINSVFVRNASGGITLHYIWTVAAKAGAFIIAGPKVVPSHGPPALCSVCSFHHSFHRGNAVLFGKVNFAMRV